MRTQRQYIEDYQAGLARRGLYSGRLDGQFGPMTWAGTSQLFEKVPVEGEVETWNFNGAAKRLEDIDIPRIGARIGVGEDELHAFMDVETSGSGFDKLGRPKMLFEPHVFYRNLTGAERNVAVRAGLAYRSWGTKPYPSNSYPRLRRAMMINETAALRSASWGLGQILGENHSMAGYATPQEMVLAFMEDEETHLEAIIEFLISAGIDDDLREHRWEVVARVYNGPGYRKHGYHTRLAAAFEKWRAIKDTPFPPEERILA